MHHILLSNEHIHGRLRAPQQLENLESFLQEFASEIHVIVYLRSQYEMSRALTNTALREGRHVTQPVPEFNTSNGRDTELSVDYSYFDLDGFLRRLEAVFGADAISTRLYPEGDRSGNSLLADFFRECGADCQHFVMPPRQNTSFDAKGTQFLNLLNGALQDAHLGLRQEVRDAITSYLSSNNAGGGARASTREIAGFMAQFADGNEALRARWFPERPILFDFPAAPDAAGPEVLTADEAIGIFVGILSQAFAATTPI